jgi:hypothetical protein
MAKPYPDISDIIARKQEARRARAALSFGEKIAIVERLRERLKPMRKAREARKSRKGHDV